MLLFFLFGDTIGLVPVVTAMIGAAVFLVWVETDVEEMLHTVDWTTLVFFMALFIAVGAIREVGLISILADALAGVIGDNLLLGLLILTWAPAFISLFIDDIPVTAAMLPVVGYLSAALDPSGTHVLFYGFAIGAAMGGNGSLIGAAPNLVAAGIADRAGFSMTYRGFMRAGLPSMLLTITVGLLWLIFAFFIAGPL
ncbi:MAG: SLC13 family permease [Anaerolineae bacterium]|nr:SLC13 family permease [Anaerolineae bacterium]